jgi:hypothetical protein
LTSIVLVGCYYEPLELSAVFQLSGFEDPTGADQAGKRAHRECAAAESKQVNAIGRVVDPTQLFVKLPHIATESHTEHAAE